MINSKFNRLCEVLRLKTQNVLKRDIYWSFNIARACHIFTIQYVVYKQPDPVMFIYIKKCTNIKQMITFIILFPVFF